MSSNERKYKNLINRFWLFWFWRRLFFLLNEIKPLNKVLEVGCGEGFVLRQINNKYPAIELYGLDIASQAVEKVKTTYPFINAQVADIYNLPFSDNEFPLVLCLEVLEHLDKPKQALAEIKRVTSNYAILSVPWEPWFSLGSLWRGKYLKTGGKHPEHINFWSKKKFSELISQYFDMVKATQSFPWLLVVVKKR